MRYNDSDRAVIWAREHWHIAGFACAALAIFAALLNYFQLFSDRAAVAAFIASAAYVVMTTWQFTHSKKIDKPG